VNRPAQPERRQPMRVTVETRIELRSLTLR